MSNALNTLINFVSTIGNIGGGIGWLLFVSIFIALGTWYVHRGQPRSNSSSMEDRYLSLQSDLPAPVPAAAQSEGKS